MIKRYFDIENIPAILWGESSDKVFVAVHGNMSNKEDDVISIFAKYAISLGYQVISFDLPEHGKRLNDGVLCKVQYCVNELRIVMDYVKNNWKYISLFACSMGAYFSLLTYKDEFISQAVFLSPVVDMKRIIDNMMRWFDISEDEFESKQIVNTPIGQNLYWDYYCYVKENPIEKWNINTSILYGLDDDLCEKDIVFNFTKRFNCKLTVMDNGKHYFHKAEELKFFEKWVERTVLKNI